MIPQNNNKPATKREAIIRLTQQPDGVISVELTFRPGYKSGPISAVQYLGLKASQYINELIISDTPNLQQ